MPDLGAPDETVRAAADLTVKYLTIDIVMQSALSICPDLVLEKGNRESDERLKEVYRAILAAVSKVMFEVVENEIEPLKAKIDGLEDDLKSAVQVAYDRGGEEWALMNYPSMAESLAENAAAVRRSTAT
jgi:hypothetical protein